MRRETGGLGWRGWRGLAPLLRAPVGRLATWRLARVARPAREGVGELAQSAEVVVPHARRGAAREEQQADGSSVEERCRPFHGGGSELAHAMERAGLKEAVQAHRLVLQHRLPRGARHPVGAGRRGAGIRLVPHLQTSVVSGGGGQHEAVLQQRRDVRSAGRQGRCGRDHVDGATLCATANCCPGQLWCGGG